MPRLVGWRLLSVSEKTEKLFTRETFVVREEVYYKHEPARVRTVIVRGAAGRRSVARLPFPELVLMAKYVTSSKVRLAHSHIKSFGIAALDGKWYGPKHSKLRLMRLPNVMGDGASICVGGSINRVRLGTLSPEEAVWMTDFECTRRWIKNGERASLVALSSRFKREGSLPPDALFWTKTQKTVPQYGEHRRLSMNKIASWL